MKSIWLPLGHINVYVTMLTGLPSGMSYSYMSAVNEERVSARPHSVSLRGEGQRRASKVRKHI